MPTKFHLYSCILQFQPFFHQYFGKFNLLYIWTAFSLVKHDAVCKKYLNGKWITKIQKYIIRVRIRHVYNIHMYRYIRVCIYVGVFCAVGIGVLVLGVHM